MKKRRQETWPSDERRGNASVWKTQILNFNRGKKKREMVDGGENTYLRSRGGGEALDLLNQKNNCDE